MDKLQLIDRLIDFLLEDMPQYRAQAAAVPSDVSSRRMLLRALMNLRPPLELKPEFLTLQDRLLTVEREEKGVVSPNDIPPCASDPRLRLWQGDITLLATDAIVNAANAALLGCFVPGHRCIDNAIHSAAGLQLRRDCARLMAAQGREEPVGCAKITPAYNLPCRYVLHTVGPFIAARVTPQDEKLLAGCYRSCLELAQQYRLKSVAFCCISTGEFHFPNERAAQIAVSTVREVLPLCPSVETVVFNVFKDVDLNIYRTLLSV